jgi:hypothetical protein
MAARSRVRVVYGLLVVVLLAGGALAWLERTTLRTWWHVHRLAKAGEADQAARAEKIAELGPPAAAAVIELLRQPDPIVCRNARAGLEALLRRPDGTEHAPEVLGQLAQGYGRFSTPARRHALELAARVLRGEGGGPRGEAAAVRLLGALGTEHEAEVLVAALELAAVLLPRTREALHPARELARSALQSGGPEVKVRAIQIALHPGMDLFESVAGLLQDPAVEVRRAALLAAGPADKAVLDETLLPCLRDPDPDIQRLAEVALRGRGLTPQHIRLGRLLTDPQPLVRLQVLDHLRFANDLEPGVWLRRLSHDPAESVRAAAIRVMAQQSVVDLRDRLEQMRRQDPSPAVCQLADVYLRMTQGTQTAER